MNKITRRVALAALIALAAAASASASTSSQRVTCSGNGDNLPCTTSMRLVCHRKTGRITLSRIPANAFEVWLATRARRGGWRTTSLLTPTSGKIAYHSRGIRQARAYVDIPNPPPTAIPAMQFRISVKCR